jgi:hypothetical protein
MVEGVLKQTRNGLLQNIAPTVSLDRPTTFVVRLIVQRDGRRHILAAFDSTIHLSNTKTRFKPTFRRFEPGRR